MTACTKCHGDDTGVLVTTRQKDGTVLRKRVCNDCGKRWLTVEKEVCNTTDNKK